MSHMPTRCTAYRCTSGIRAAVCGAKSNVGRSVPANRIREGPNKELAGTMTVSGKTRSQEAKTSRWGVIALPLSVFVGVVLGAVVGAAVGHIGIGVAVGAGFGVGVGVAVTVAVFVFRSEPPGSQ